MVLVQSLLVSGYAFLNIFTWAITADLSTKRRAPLFYTAILGTNVLAILIGIWVEDKIGYHSNDAAILTVCLGGVLSFWAFAFILSFSNRILQYNPGPLIPQASSFLNNWSQKVDFTPRENEIVELLIVGCSTAEILEKQSITASTLKTHLRNIYRKVGVSNRLEFTLALMKEIDNSKKGKFSVINLRG